MLLISSLKGSIETGTNILNAPKTAVWVYQMTKVSEMALYTLVQEELGTAGDNPSIVMNPYFLFLDTITKDTHYGTQDDEKKALFSLLYHLGISTQYSVFDALSACIVHQVDEMGSRVTNYQLRQLIVRLAAETLQLLRRNVEPSYPMDKLRLQFGTIILLSPTSITSPITHNITSRAFATEHVAFWTSILHSIQASSLMSSLSWSQIAIFVGNVIDLTIYCAFPAPLVARVPFLLSPIISSSHLQWAFPAPEESNTVLDDEMDTTQKLPLPFLPIIAACPDESHALGQFECRVRIQWQKLCYSTFGSKCLDLVLQADNKLAFRHLCHVLTLVVLSTGHAHVLTVAATFANPPAPLFALLSTLTVEQDASNLIQRLWHQLESVTSSLLAGKASSNNEHEWNLLLLLNVMYSHVLLGLDDETFYTREWPLELAHVTAFVTFLKQWIYEKCWKPSTTQYTPTHELLRLATVVTSVKLFNQLYDRDCRRRFLPDHAWLWPSMPPLKELVDLHVMQEDATEINAIQAIATLVTPNSTLSSSTRVALILQTLPQVFAFLDRVELFQKLLEADKTQLTPLRAEFARALHVQIQRDAIVDDSFAFFQHVCATQAPSALKARVKVTFINEQGLEEAGIDGGGVFKEYMDTLTKQAFSPASGFFIETLTSHRLCPNPSARYLVDTPQDAMDRYRFLGRVLAKAVYENILVEPQFAAFFLKKLLGKFNYIDDLPSLDPELYTSLMRLKQYDGDMEDLALTFSVDENEFGSIVSRPLVPNGAQSSVTKANRIRYIHLLAHYKLNVQAAVESRAFVQGFRDLIPASWLEMFAPTELQLLIGGRATIIDIEEWERATEYGGGYHPSQDVIQWFWDIVRHELTLEDRAALLKFITSCYLF